MDLRLKRFKPRRYQKARLGSLFFLKSSSYPKVAEANAVSECGKSVTIHRPSVTELCVTNASYGLPRRPYWNSFAKRLIAIYLKLNRYLGCCKTAMQIRAIRNQSSTRFACAADVLCKTVQCKKIGFDLYIYQRKRDTSWNKPTPRRHRVSLEATEKKDDDYVGFCC